jgi:uncharacterized protein YbaR (Trm112 family)
MQISILSDICCPGMLNGNPCQGQLFLDKVTLPPVYTNNDQEINEGILRCKRCDAEYPIICGLPILLIDSWTYVRRNYDVLLRLTTEAGQPISQSMLNVFQAHKVGLGNPTSVNKYDSPGVLNTYLCQHYDDICELLPSNHPLREIFCKKHSQDFYALALELLIPHLNSIHKVLDIGCSVGRSTYDLATQCAEVYGIEFSYASAFVARRILRHLPSQLEHYSLKREGDIYQNRQIPNHLRDNVEIIIASGENLPFRTATFDAVNSWLY